MGKLIAVGVAVIALVVYVRHPHGPSAAKVAGCLQKHGATVERSTFFEDAFGIAASGPLPEDLRNDLKQAEKHLYDVTIAADSGFLMDTKRERQAADLEAAAAARGLDVTAQGRDKVLMIWSGGPSAASRATLDRCLR